MKENRVAIQESSPWWSDSVSPGMCVVIIRGIGASDSVAFCTTVGIIERSGRLRSKSPVAGNLFPWVRSLLRHALTHGYCRKSLRDSVIRPYLNRIARAVRPYNLGINSFFLHTLASKSCRKGAGSAYALQDVSPGCSDSETRGVSQLTKRGFGAERSRAFCTMLAQKY